MTLEDSLRKPASKGCEGAARPVVVTRMHSDYVRQSMERLVLTALQDYTSRPNWPRTEQLQSLSHFQFGPRCR